MTPALSLEARRSATPCLVTAFDELHSNTGNKTIRNMIDQRPYDPDNLQAIFDAATPASLRTPFVAHCLTWLAVAIGVGAIIAAVFS